MITLASALRTPVSNTGLIPQNQFICSIDTLTLVFRNVGSASGAIAIKGLFEDVLGEHIEFDVNCPTFMMRRWSGCSSSSLLGTMLHWLAPNEDRPGMLRVHLPGRALRGADRGELRDLIQVLWGVFSGSCTRLDAAADDYDKVTNLEDIARAQTDRNYTGVRSHRWAGSGSLGEEDGLTYYFGAASSDSQLRIYDKAIESSGKQDCIRWELQVRRGKAEALCKKWLCADIREDSEIASILSGAIAGAVDFIDRSKGQKDLSRCSRLPWWEGIKKRLARAFRLRPPMRVPTMESKISWICRAVSPSLATIKKYMGLSQFWQFIEDEITESESVLSSRNKAIVAEAIAIDRERERDREKAVSRVGIGISVDSGGLCCDSC